MFVTILSLGWVCNTIYTSIFAGYALLHPRFNDAVHFIGAWLANCLFVLLMCTFVPSSKKYVGLFFILICLVYIIFQYFGEGQNAIALCWDIAGASGLLVGYFLSYLLFKNNGWGLSHKTGGQEP